MYYALYNYYTVLSSAQLTLTLTLATRVPEFDLERGNP
jgi:hypothetical protein